MNSQSGVPGKSAPEPDQTHVLMRSARKPDLTLRYGDQADHVADVHLPPPAVLSDEEIGPRKFFTLFIHGGFWKPEYDRAHTAPLAEALAAAGFVVGVPEYRRTAQVGGGWPGTFDDIAAAGDKLPSLVADATDGLVDPSRLVLAGHSGGGHLALAAVSALAACSRLNLGQGAADAFMGGGPEQHPDRYAAADPAVLLPVGHRVRLIHGGLDDIVPPQMSAEYAERARAAGDADVECLLLPDAGHFEVIDPLSAA